MYSSLCDELRCRSNKAGPPPTLAIRPVCRCVGRCVARIAILDQECAAQATVSAAKGAQFSDVALGIFLRLDDQFHSAAVDDQEQQQVYGAVSLVLELLLFNRTWPRTPDWASLQNLEVWNLIDANDPESACSQTLGISVAPQHLLGPF